MIYVDVSVNYSNTPFLLNTATSMTVSDPQISRYSRSPWFPAECSRTLFAERLPSSGSGRALFPGRAGIIAGTEPFAKARRYSNRNERRIIRTARVIPVTGMHEGKARGGSPRLGQG